MGLGDRLNSILHSQRYSFLFFMIVSSIPRLIAWAFLPLDWNSDSYHHWQISYLTLKIGLRHGRMWDLNGCEYYWGILPHLVHALLLWIFSTASILPYRILNFLLGGVNAYLVYLIGQDNFNLDTGFYAGLLFALFPVAAIFDVIAMQETLALCFCLTSMYLFRSRPGWSGVFLALACQSRIEFWLVSIGFVFCVVLIDRLSVQVQPFVLSWLGITGFFCLLFHSWTSNPIYPLYWSLFNVFGGWTQGREGLPFIFLMFSWIAEKLEAWIKKATGLFLLGSFAALCGIFLDMLRRRWRRYYFVLFFLHVLVVFSPLFVPYYPMHIAHMLLMLRMSLPIAAFGYPLLVSTVLKAKLRPLRDRLRSLHIEKILIILTIASYSYFIPAYREFQREPQIAFESADRAIAHYEGGTIICDHPTMNYRFASRWHVKASNLLGNHYSPHYYGVTDPLEYARWFYKNNVTLWIYTNDLANPVWSVVDGDIQGLLVKKDEVYSMKIYEVDRTFLDGFLTN